MCPACRGARRRSDHPQREQEAATDPYAEPQGLKSGPVASRRPHASYMGPYLSGEPGGHRRRRRKIPTSTAIAPIR